MIRRLAQPRVHGAWTRAWWDGDRGWEDLLGPRPSAEAAARLAEQLTAPPGWTSALRGAEREPVDPDALVVLAGQQPVLGGGAALVAHKAATAVAAARRLREHLGRPVLPVFLLATQDHDSTEVDHLDLIHPSNGVLERLRCPLVPRSEMFARSAWDDDLFRDVKGVLHSTYGLDEYHLGSTLVSTPAPEHVARLLETAFAGTGLRLVEAHRLEAPRVLGTALADREPIGRELARGADRLRALGKPASFDPNDPRPLVLESRGGRRRRLEPDDPDARARLDARPEDFSPHAALRPIVQAATLPVVAQVCGPSEILYLGQARGLHERFGVTAPLLVPRLEATRVPEADIARLDDALRPERSGSDVDEPLEELAAAGDRFRAAVAALDPSLAARVERLTETTTRRARSVAEALEWRGRAGRLDARLRPRGRAQDAVLGWLPDAFGRGAPDDWAERIVALSAPFDPPAHVLYAFPEEPS